MMLVGAQAVKAGFGGEQELIERRVVILADLVGIGDVEPQRIDVSRFVTLVEIRRQAPIGHQMEHADFHGDASPAKYISYRGMLRGGRS
jgi:hypothetical protein